eukprot:scaffold655713_cov74-Prasinocladus_malaysianus.AAC.1
MSNNSRAEVLETREVFDKLPHSLQIAVAQHLSRWVIEEVPIMQHCNGNFIDALCALLKVLTFPLNLNIGEEVMTRDAFLFRTNEVTNKLFFIHTVRNSYYFGSIEFVVEEDDSLMVTQALGPGSAFGYISFFFQMKQTESARSKLGSVGAKLFTLSREV